jgi:hypothetical protein
MVMTLSNWFSKMTIGFPVSPDTAENKIMNMGYIPLISAIILLFTYMTYYNYNFFWKNRTGRYFSSVFLFSSLSLLLLYMVSVNKIPIDLTYLPYVLSVVFFVGLISYFHEDYILNTTLGKVSIAFFIGLCILSLF